jgi:hypothetical protein
VSIYTVRWVEKIAYHAPVEADSAEEAIEIAKQSVAFDLDIDTDPMYGTAHKYAAELLESEK